MFFCEFDAHDEVAATQAHDALLEYLRKEAENEEELSGPYLQRKTEHEDNLTGAEVIFTELVSNVRKHAASRASVGVSWRIDGRAVLEVTDEGPGLDLSDWRPAHHLADHGRGLVIVSALSGDVAVTPRPGRGTRIKAVLPLRRRPRRQQIVA